VARRRHTDEFNPWPAFVDLFASVIMLVLMFMLILIVNVAFYAQFKFKVSYTGTVPVEKPIEQTEPVQEFENKEIQSAGVDLTRIDTNATRQENIIHLDWMVVKYLDNEIVLDPPIMAEIETFIKTAKSQIGNHYVSIFTSEPKNQTSATVAKQIGLSRALNIRNYIRSLQYEKDDVRVDLKGQIPQDKSVDHEAGYIVITINQKR
jgi:hypothetical protein